MGPVATAAYERNLRLSEEEFRQGKTVLESWPVDLMMILTTRCNLQCIHCAREVSRKVLPEEAAFKVAPLFPYLRFLNLQGGEAFLAPYLRRFLEEAVKHPNIDAYITTSGTLITADWADFLVQAGVSLAFSIDGATKATYERIRRPAKFERLLHSLDLINGACAKRGKRVSKDLCVAVMRSNYREVELFVDFAKRHDFDSVLFFPIIGDGPAAQPEEGRIYYQHEENIFHHQDQEAFAFLQRVRPAVLEAAASLGLRAEWHLTFPDGAAPGKKSAVAAEPVPRKAGFPESLCVRPWRMLHVTAVERGNAYPDCYCRVPAGNLVTDSLDQIWNGEVMQRYRALLLEKRMAGFCSEPCVSGTIDPAILGAWR